MPDAIASATLPPAGDPNTVYVLDISSYIFRAYHALPPLSNSKGEPTHAVAGNPMRFRQGDIELRLDDEWRSRMPRRDRAVTAAITWPLRLAYGYGGRGRTA